MNAKAIKTVNTIGAFTSATLMMLGLLEAEWILSLAMAGTLTVCFMVEAEMI